MGIFRNLLVIHQWRAKALILMPLPNDSGTPQSNIGTNYHSAGFAVDPMLIDLVGSEQVRRHPHHYP